MAFVLDFAPSPVPDAAASIATALEEDIVLGRLKPRERLVEEDLAERFGANRGVVRRALAELEQSGLVAREVNRGAKVRDYDLVEIEEIYELREVLLERAIRRTPLPVPAAAMAAIRAAGDAHADAVARRDAGAIHHANVLFHDRIFDLCPNRHLVRVLKHATWLLMVIRAYRAVDVRAREAAVEQHAAIVAALEAADRKLFLARSLAHIRTPAEIVERLERWMGSGTAP